MSEPAKRKKPAALTPRSLKVLREDGWYAEVVERFIRLPNHPAGGFRRDLFGFGDVLALKGDVALIVQVCRAADVATRLDKIRETTVELQRGDQKIEVLALSLALAAHFRVEIHGWASPTTTRRRWRQRIVVVGADDVSEQRVWRQAARTPVTSEQPALFDDDLAAAAEEG